MMHPTMVLTVTNDQRRQLAAKQANAQAAVQGRRADIFVLDDLGDLPDLSAPEITTGYGSDDNET